MELVMNPSPPQEEGFGISHQDVPGDPLESFGATRDPPSIVRGLVDPKNDDGQSSKVGSWSDDNDQPLSEVGTVDPKAKKTQ